MNIFKSLIFLLGSLLSVFAQQATPELVPGTNPVSVKDYAYEQRFPLVGYRWGERPDRAVTLYPDYLHLHETESGSELISNGTHTLVFDDAANWKEELRNLGLITVIPEGTKPLPSTRMLVDRIKKSFASMAEYVANTLSTAYNYFNLHVRNF